MSHMEHHNFSPPDFGSVPQPPAQPTPPPTSEPPASHPHHGQEVNLAHSHHQPQGDPPAAPPNIPAGGQPFPPGDPGYYPPAGGYPPGGPYAPPGAPYYQPGVYPPSPQYYAPGGRAYGLPSVNGGLILTLGILSFFCFGIILGPVTWVMGNSALNSIDSGQADPSERGNVSAGRICAIISTCLHGIGLLIYGGLLIIGLAFGAGSGGSHP